MFILSCLCVGMLIESMAGKSSSLHGLTHDATSFVYSDEEPAADYFGSLLTKGTSSLSLSYSPLLLLCAAGYNYYGSERMYSGIDGREFEVDIFFGVVYYQRLRHMVADKYQASWNGIA